MQTIQELIERYGDVLSNKGFKYAVITNEEAREDGILVVGMNPSGSGKESDKPYDTYQYLKCGTDEGKYDSFWSPKHQMMGYRSSLDYDQKCGYVDLFPVRLGDQAKFAQYNDSENLLMGQLLSITQDYIEAMRPRLIIFANTSDYYWGFRKKKNITEQTNGVGFWMGYKFQKLCSPLKGVQQKDYWPYYKIVGIEPSGVNRNRIKTNLDGTYFLRYRQHEAHGKVVLPERELKPEDIKTIVESIDPEWAKSLL